MTEVVLAELESLLPIDAILDLIEAAAQERLQEELLAQPKRNGESERLEPTRAEGEVGLDEPLELEERLVVERDNVDVLQAASRGLEAILDRPVREARVELLACEALLLGRCHDAALLDNGRGTVVVEG